jgi:hypothetical protein
VGVALIIQDHLEEVPNMGRPRSYTPAELDKAIDDYYARCELDGVCPDYAGLRVHLGVGKSTLDRYCNPDEHPEDYTEYRETLARARDRRESWFVRRMAAEPRTATGCIAALKQADNGGWVDRQEVGASVTISIAGGVDVKAAGK